MSNSDRPISQHDVARLAGVSQAAVSRTFTDGASVSPETRRQVLEAAEALGYRPNAIARSLIKHSTKIIGIVLVRFGNPFYWYVFREFTRRLQERGYWTLLLNAAQDQQVEETLPMALQYQVDGVIVTSATLSSKMADEAARAGTPVVLFNRYELDTTANAVCCDNVGGGRLVADALLDAGHVWPAYIAGEEGSSTNRDRERGFTERLAERGHTLALREAALEYTYPAGYAAANRLLRSENRPDAIFCASDLIAMGALDCARDLGINVPEQLSIVGYDDIEMAGWPPYSLTTVRQPADRLVETSIEVLLNAIENPGQEPVIEWIPVDLVRRNSARL
ncbi:MAG: LacI family DNA-binding transcriptional regulator [Chloroflexi bacterium]|nr:MAG: LacI family DNA-binding transcriptional regulator [Chloroflexota bacterium]